MLALLPVSASPDPSVIVTSEFEVHRQEATDSPGVEFVKSSEHGKLPAELEI